jgi:hypothetical protein
MSPLIPDQRTEYEEKIRTLVNHAWDHEVSWGEVNAWLNNFNGKIYTQDKEKLYALLSLSRYMYFSKRLIREMLKSLYRDHFESPLLQRIRRNLGGTSDSLLIRKVYDTELLGTRFIGVGNPAESGAHLLYYFRQVNRLPKKLFVDIAGAFSQKIIGQCSSNSKASSERLGYFPVEQNVSRYVFFDDLVGSGTQASRYLTNHLRKIRETNKDIDISFVSLFATTKGLAKLNEPSLFDGKAMSLFELDETYKAFETTSRYFSNPPIWFDCLELKNIAEGYGRKLDSTGPLGFGDGQLLLSFTHNTPNNAPPIFWNEGYQIPWSPVFIRYDKIYGSAP